MDNGDDSNPVNRIFGKKIILILIVVLVLIIIFTVLFFGIFHISVPIDDNSKLLPASCYMINGKQICPKG
jgi:hypothetical protein